MKYQQVSVDFVNMVFTACSYLALAGAAWIFLRLLQACFWLPRHLRKQNDVQAMLQEKVDSYEKYLLECEEKEKAAESGEAPENPDSAADVNKTDVRPNEEKWKERRECLEMLKRELKRVRDGGDVYDWDYLLEDDEKDEKAEKDEKENATEGDGETDGANKNKDSSTVVDDSEVDCEIIDDPTKNENGNEAKKDK